MSRSAYGFGPCHWCGKQMTTAGFAVFAHMKKHAREGRVLMMRGMVEYGVRKTYRVEHHLFIAPTDVARLESAKRRGYVEVSP